MPKNTTSEKRVPIRPTLSIAGSYESVEEGVKFALAAAQVDSLRPDIKQGFVQGSVNCIPQFESNNIVYKNNASGSSRSSIVSPLTAPIRVWLRQQDNPNSESSRYSLEFKLSAKTTAFEDEDLSKPLTDEATFFSNFASVFGPEGSSNEMLAEHLKPMVKSFKKKLNGSALHSASNASDVLKEIVADCKRGFVAGAGTSPQFMPKQTCKLWTQEKEDKDGESTKTTFVQITIAVTNLFKESETQSKEEHDTDCALLRTGSELHTFLVNNPTLTVNRSALRVNVAREDPNKNATWIDIANLISHASPAEQTNRSVTLIGQLNAAPWQTWINKDRMRVLFKMYLNGIDVFAVERPYSADVPKKLMINEAAANAFDRKRNRDDETSSDEDNYVPEKKQRQEGSANDLAD
jgi:hypothetical protein